MMPWEEGNVFWGFLDNLRYDCEVNKFIFNIVSSALPVADTKSGHLCRAILNISETSLEEKHHLNTQPPS